MIVDGVAHGASRGVLAALTVAALCCFAGNSLLARAALRAGEIDAASYTLIRLASGAAMLFALLRLRRARSGSWMPRGGSWASAAALFLYAGLFSLAYLRLSAGTG